MAGAASASSPGHGGLSIPKIKKRTFKDCIQHVSVNNRDVQNLLQDVSKNCLDVNFMKKIDILQVSMVHSAKLQSQYVQKKTEMKESGRSPQSLVDQLGFRITDHEGKHKIAKEGLCAQDKDSILGRGDCGVCLTRYFDVEVNYFLQKCPTVEIFIFKYFAGKCKLMSVGNVYKKTSNIEPTPNFDSHGGSSLPNLNEHPYVQVCKSIIYLYEYTDECVPSKYPRHCLPFAVIKVKKASEAVRPVNVPRVIPPAAAACGDSSCDKPPSSPDVSRVNASSKASSTKTQASLISKTGSPLQSLLESDAKGPVNISNRRDSSNPNIIVIIGETQDASSKENAATVKMDGVKNKLEHKPSEALGSKLLQKDRKANLAGEGSSASKKESLNLLIESQSQYLKRLGAAREKLNAEKNSKMSECLQFILPPEPQESASLNGLSASFMTKASVGPPRVDNSKCASFVVPDSHNSMQRTDRFGDNTNMFNRHTPHTATGQHSINCVKESVSTDSAARNHLSYTSHPAGRTPLFGYVSANEGSHRNIDATSQVWNQSVDPRLFKRGQSTSSSSSSNVPSSHNPANKSVGVRVPIKSALKKVDSQNVVKTKISLSDYKKLKAQQQSDSVPSVLVSNDAVVHEKSTTGLSSIPGHIKANSTKDCTSQNSVTTLQSQNVQTQRLQCLTAKIDNKLPNSSNHKTGSVSTAASAHISCSVSTAGSAPTRSVPTYDSAPSPVSTVSSVSAVAEYKLTPYCDTQSVLSAQRSRGCEANYPASDGAAVDVSLQDSTKSATLQTPGKTSNIFHSFVGVNFQWTDPLLVVPPKPDSTSFNLDVRKKLSNIDKVSGNMFQKTTMPVKDSGMGNIKKGQLREYEDCGLTNQPQVIPNLQTKHVDTISDSVEVQSTEVIPPLTPCCDNDADRNNHRMIAQAEVNKQADKHRLQFESLGESTSVPKSLTDFQTYGIRTKPDNLITSNVEVTSNVEDTNTLASSHFAPIHSAAVGMNQHMVMTPTPLRHDQEMESYSEDSLSSEDEYGSYVEASTSEPDFLSQGDSRKLERELYGDKPLPRSISMRDVGIECYLLALGDMNFQPLAIVVDYIEARCKKACKVCEASLQHFPGKYQTSVNVTEMEKQTGVAAALPSAITLEEQLGVDSSFEASSPDALREVMAGVNSVAAALCGITLEEQLGVDNSFEVPSRDASKEVMAGMNSVAAAFHGISLEEQLGGENTCKVSSLETSRIALSGKDSVVAALSGGITLEEQLGGAGSCEMSSLEASRTALPGEDSISAAFCGITLKEQLGGKNTCKMSNLVALSGKESVPLPGSENYSSVNSNQPNETGQNACSKPDIVATRDIFRTEPSMREAAASLLSPSDASCSKSLSKRESCSAGTRETNTLTSQSNSASTVTLTETHVIRNYVPIPALTASKDGPEISQKSSNKNLVVAYSDTDTSSSDDEELNVTKATQENYVSSKYHGISRTEAHAPEEKPSEGSELEDSRSDEAFREHLLEETYVKGLLERNIKQSNLRNKNESNTNAVPHTPMKEPPGGWELEDSKSDETFREHLLEETYMNGLLQKQITSQKVLTDASNRMRPPPTLNEKYSSEVIEVKDSSSDEEILQGHSLTALCKANRPLERKGLVSQQVVKDTSNIKIETVAIMDVSSDGNEHQGVIDSVKCRAGDVIPATRCKSRSRSPCEDKAKEVCDQSVNERNHLALSNTSAQGGNDLSLPLSEPDKMRPEKDILAKISFHQTLPDKTSSEFAPTCVNSNLNCTQKVLPENYVAQKVQSVTKENALDSQAPHFSMGEKQKGSIGAKAQVSAMTKVDKMKLVAKNSADKHVQVQKGVTSYDSMTESSSEESPNHRTVNKCNHIKPDNSSSGVKLFLEKVRESVEVKKHIDEELLAFQKLINCDKTDGNSESIIHKPVAFHDKNQKLLSNVSYPSCTKESNEIQPSCNKVLTTIATNSKEHALSQIANKTCTDQNKKASISETDGQDGSPVSPGSMASAFGNLQENTESSTVLSTPAEVWKHPLMPTKRIETIITNNSHTALASSHVDNPVVDDREGLSLCQVDTDYRVQAYFTTADVDERSILQQSFGGGDLRTQTLTSIPVVQHNFAISNQVHTTADVDERSILQQSFGGGDLRTRSVTSIPVVQQNFAISNQVHYYTNYFPQGSHLWNQGINSSSHMPLRYPYTHTRPTFPQQTWTVPQNVHVNAPIVDLGNTFMADQDYRHMRPEGQMSTSRNVLVNYHKPPERDVRAAAATMPLPAAGGQRNLPPNRSTFSNYMETMNVQKQSSGNCNNQGSSSFWLSRDQSSTNISGLGFDPSGTKVSDIPGLGDVAQNHDDGERRWQLPPEAEATASSSEGVNKTSFDAKAIYPEIYNSSNLFSNASIKERCRSILKSVNSSSEKVVDTAVKSIKINDEDYSDDEQTDSPLPVTHDKEHSGCDSDILQHSANVPQNAEVPFRETSPDHEKEENSKLSKLLYAHLSNVISKVSSAPKVESKDPLPVLELLRKTLEKTHKDLLEEASEDTETSQTEDAEHDIDTCPNSRELDQDEMSDSCRVIDETLSPTKSLQNTVLLNTKCQSPKIEFTEVYNSDVCLRPELEEQLDMETPLTRQSGTSPMKSINSADNSSSDIKRSESTAAIIEDTKNIPSISEKLPNSTPQRAWSSLPAPRSSSSPTIKSAVSKEVDLPPKRPSESPLKSREDDTSLELNTVTRFTYENIGSPTVSTVSVDTKNSSQFPPLCKDTEMSTVCGKGITEVSDQKLPVKETASVVDCLPTDTTNVNTLAPINTTISVSSNGKIYLSDVPLDALSYAREKILSEINRLGDAEVASPPETPTCELTSIDAETVRASGGSPVSDFEEGEISSDSECKQLGKQIVPVQKSKLLCENKRLKRKKSHADKGDCKNERKKIVKRDSVRNEKLYSVTENNSKVDLCHRKQRLNDDVIYISDDSDTECHTSLRKVKTAIDKMNTVNRLFAASKDKEKGATSKAYHQSERIYINSRKKKSHKIDPQILLSKVKSEVKTETSIADYLRDLDQMSEESSSESEYVDKISGSVSDTALLKPCVATKQSAVMQTSPEPIRAGRYGHCRQTAEKLRKFSIFGENIVVQVFNEKSLLCDSSKNITSSGAIQQHPNNEEQSNDQPKTYKNLPLCVDTTESSDKDQEVALLNAEQQSLLRCRGNSSSLVVAKKQCNTSRQAVSLQLENIKCDRREQLPGISSRVPTDDHKLGSPGETLLNFQMQVKESLSSTEKCQNAHTSVTSEVDIENSKKDLNRKLIHKPEPSLKHGPAKRCYRDQVRHSETETESDLADAFRPAPSKRTSSDRARPYKTETETEATDSCSDVYRKSLSPYSRDAKRKRTDRSYEGSPYSRKRRRSSSSSSSGSRNRSLSPRSRNSRSSSRLSKDSSLYHRRRYYRRDQRSRSSSRYRSRHSTSPSYSRRRHSTSPTSYSRHSRSRSRSRCSSRKRDDRYRRSVSSSRSRDSSPSDGYHRYKSKSPRRYCRGDSHSPSARRSIGSKTSNWSKRDYYSKSRNDKFWTLMNQSLQISKSKNQHPFDMLYSITNMSTQKSASNSGNMLNSNIQKSTLPHTGGTVNASGVCVPKQITSTATLANMSVPKQITSTATLANISVPKQITSTATLANMGLPKQITSTATLTNMGLPKQITSTATLANMSVPKQITSTAAVTDLSAPKQVTSTATLANMSVPKQVTSTATLANISVPKQVTSTATVTDLSAPKQVSNTAALTKVVALKQVSALKNVSETLTNVSAPKQIGGATILTIVGAPRQVKGTAVLKNMSAPKQVSGTATLTNASTPMQVSGTTTLTNASAPKQVIGTATLTNVSAPKQESGTATLTNMSAPKQLIGTASLTNASAPKLVSNGTATLTNMSTPKQESGTATLTNVSAPKQPSGTATLTNVSAPKQPSGTATLTNVSAPKQLIGTATSTNASAPKLVSNTAAVSNVVSIKQVSGTVTLANVSAPKRVSGPATVANVCPPKQVSGPATVANVCPPKQVSGPATVANVCPPKQVSGPATLTNLSAPKRVSGPATLTNLSAPKQVNGPATLTNLSAPKQVSGPATLTNLSAPKQVSGPATATNVCSTGSSSNTSTQKCTVDTGSKSVVKLKTEACKVLTNDTRTSECQKATDLVKSGATVNEMSTTVGKAPVVREHPIASSSTDYSEMLQSYQSYHQAKPANSQSKPANSQYLRNHNVTVKHLIIFQLGISITDELKALLPYSPHTVLSDRHLSREVQQKRCMETIQCCLKHLSVSAELVSKCKIEPVISSFGNLPFEDRLEHFCNEQVLLEVNVIKQCQYVLEEQQGQVHLLKSYIKHRLGKEPRAIFEPGTYAGDPLPEDLQVPVRGFTFIVPREFLHEDVALSIKDALQASYECILELMKTTDFGREHFRVPEILLLEEEKFEMYSQGHCFLVLNKSLPKKVFTRLLTIKNGIESIRQDTRKSNGEKYACEKQLIGERVSVLLSHIGNVTHKRVSKLRTLYNQLQDCEMYMRKVIGAEGLRNLPLFDRYMSAVKHHFEILNEEFKHPSYPYYE